MPLDTKGGCLCSGYLVLGECNCEPSQAPSFSNQISYVNSVINNGGIPGWEVTLYVEGSKTIRRFHVLNARSDDRTGHVKMTLVPLELIELVGQTKDPSTPLEESIKAPPRRYKFDNE